MKKVLSDNSAKKHKKLQKTKKHKNLVFVFLRTFLIVIGLFILCGVIGVLAFNKIGVNSKQIIPQPTTESGTVIKAQTTDAINAKDNSSLFGIPETTSVLVLGTDGDNARTDTMMLIVYDKSTKTTSLVSIPRDTYVHMPAERKDFLKSKGKYVPDGMKINAIHVYGGSDYGTEFAKDQVEEICNIKINYTVVIDLTQFQKIFDSIGGIQYDVPQNMDYDDPYQNLHIHLKKGMQTLNSYQVMCLCRFREYKNGDLQRIQVQQDFLKTLLSQVLSTGNISKTLPALLNVVYNNVETNITLTEALKYVPYVMKVDPSKIKSYTLPATPERLDGSDILTNDAAGTKKMMEEVFNVNGNSDSSTDTSTDSPIDSSANASDSSLSSSKNLNIEILNGTGIAGAATKEQTRLKRMGYNVSKVDTYQGDKVVGTKIYVNKDGLGQDLQSLYTNSEISTNSTITEVYDIVIVLGTSGN